MKKQARSLFAETTAWRDRQARTLVSPRGLELLGVSAGKAVQYNATLVYDGNPSYLTAFGRGGLLLPVTRVTGPAQFFGYDVSIGLGAGSAVRMAAGSSLALADWTRLAVQVSNGTVTRLSYLNVTAGAPAKEDPARRRRLERPSQKLAQWAR